LRDKNRSRARIVVCWRAIRVEELGSQLGGNHNLFLYSYKQVTRMMGHYRDVKRGA
jgi:hypothetical protein